MLKNFVKFFATKQGLNKVQMGGTALNITSSARITASNHPLKTPFFQITPIKRDNRLQQ
jgi:hypothetical protein